MSGPKGYNYVVQSAELERRRVVEDARGRCRASWERALVDIAEAGEYGRRGLSVAEPPKIDAGTSSAEAERIAAEYAETCRSVAAARDEARVDAIARAFARQLPASLAGSDITIDWSSGRADREASSDVSAGVLGHATAPGAASDAHADRDRLVERILTGLVEIADATKRNAWFDEANALLDAGADGTSATRLLRALEREVARELRAQRHTERIRAEADEIALTIAAIDSPTASRARASLSVASDRDGLRAAAELARAARAEHVDLEERRFVIEQTIEALAELGYDVEGEFRTTAFEGDFAVATKSGLPEHALQVRFVGDRMLTNTVSLVGGTSSAADVAAEDETCSDLAAVEARVRRHGVTLERRHATPSGAVPVERHLERTATDRAAISRRAEASRDRARPHGGQERLR
ncbi:hypothetical protein ACFQ58_13320 [Agromyces sp. NPDC056523]|uniref:hypothetical protein n=1 Tax=Agromyces sp. NPDC056523 TaxID=3345850 RepID=UPI00366B06A9